MPLVRSHLCYAAKAWLFVSMPFPDPEDRPDTLGETIEYWVVGALLVAASANGIYYGLRSILGRW